MRILFIIIIFLLSNFNSKDSFGQSKYMPAMQAFYDSLCFYGVSYPKTSLAIAMVETGFVNESKPPKNYNYFGFKAKKYLTFKSKTECIIYLKRWQDKFYTPWRDKNPGKNYYEFLKHIHYAGKMNLFLRLVKKHEIWIESNLNFKKAIDYPSITPLSDTTKAKY